jgi:dihydroorotase
MENQTMYDILLRDGEIIDPSQGLRILGSVGIRDGKIAAAGPGGSDPGAKAVFDLRGKIIAPGLIDLHCHPAHGFAALGVPVDEAGVHTGVTLLGDGGSAGAANFNAFRRLVVQPAQTEVICFLNLATAGLIAMPEIHTLHDIDPELSRKTVDANRNLIRGIKVRAIQPLAEGLGLKGIETAKKLAADLGLPLMMHIGETRERMEKDRMDDFSRSAVSLLDRGDILSHFLTWEPGGMILEDGTVYPELDAARKRGVYLDSSHGMNHFSFAVARHALAQGFFPSIISTDLSANNSSVTQSLPVIMSKFLNLGLTLDQVIEKTTSNPARAIGEEGRKGSLKVGTPADITVMELVKGDYLFSDGKGRGSLRGTLLLEPRMVFKKGEMRPAYSRYQVPPLFTI